MAWWRRKRSGPRGGAASSVRESPTETYEHMAEFVRTRVGVEAYVEPANVQTPTTLILIATTGEWTRRPVTGPRHAYDVAARLGVPCYDVNFTGYPQRMRDWNRRQRESRRGV